MCSLFSVLHYLNSSTYIRTYLNHKKRHECTNLESLLRYNVYKHNNYINKYTLYILNEDMNGWRRDRYKNLKLAYKLTLSSTSKIKKKIYKYIVHHNGHFALSNVKTVVMWVPFHMTMKNCWSADWLNMKTKVTNAYVCRLSLSLTWGWHSVSRRQRHDLKN